MVQAFANEDVERAKFKKKGNEAFYTLRMITITQWVHLKRLTLSSKVLCTPLTIIVGGFLIANGRMSIGDMAMVALYIGVFVSPINILVELTEMLQKGIFWI